MRTIRYLLTEGNLTMFATVDEHQTDINKQKSNKDGLNWERLRGTAYDGLERIIVG